MEINMLIFCLIVTVLVVGLDQLTKLLTLHYLPSTGDTFEFIPKVLNFTYIENRGAAFGMLADKRWVFILISIVVIVVMIAFIIIKKPKDVLLCTSVSMIVGGGIGNMIDRIFRGYVVDMIDVQFIDFYVFNVADSAVCVGCGLLILYTILDEIRQKKAKK